MKPHRPAPMVAPPSRYTAWLTLCIVGLGVSVGPLDSAVNIAFPAITTAFDIAVPTIQWVVICYVLTNASLLLGCGRLGDIVGHKRVFLLGLCWSAVSLFLCGSTSSFGWFLLFRGFQGVGTALVTSCAPALVTLGFAEEERGKVLGLYTMLFAVASALGPLVGGLLVARWGWSVVYYFRVPIALVSALLVVLCIRQPAVITPGQRFDGLGALTLTVVLVASLLALNRGNHFGWLSLPTLLLFSTAGASLTVFMRHARRYPEPVIDLTLFRYTAFSIANVAHILVNLAAFMVFLLVPYYLLNYYHASVAMGGLLLAIAPLGSMLASPIGGWLLYRYTARRLSLCGLLLVACGLFAIGQWQPHAATALIVGVLLGHGFGLGLFQVANMDFVMGAIPRHQQGVAGSLTTLTRTIGVVGGASIGALIFGVLQPWYTARLQAASLPEAAINVQAFMLAFQGAFRSAAAIAAVALLLMWSSRFTSERRPLD